MEFPKSFAELENIVNLDRYIMCQNGNIIFNMSRVGFISPLAAIWTLSTAELLKRKCRSLEIIPPNTLNPVSWLERLDFFRYADPRWLNSFENIHDMDMLKKRHRNDLSNDIVEIQRVEDGESVHRIKESVERVLNVHGRSIVNKITSIVTELSGNIVDHSKTVGYIAVQYYPNMKKVEIAIGDSGIGIVQSLKPILNGIDNTKIVEKSFEDRISSLVNENRGLGLGNVRQKTTVGNQKYEFRLLTNGGVYRIFDNRIDEEIRGSFVPFGTYYEIKIWD